MGDVCGLLFFKVSKVRLALSQMEGMVTLNSYGHGYVEKIKFQLCFGVLLTAFLPHFHEHRHGRGKFGEGMRYSSITWFTSGMKSVF